MDFARARCEDHSVSSTGKEVSIGMKTVRLAPASEESGDSRQLKNREEHKSSNVNL
jgi:hypothetical protein